MLRFSRRVQITFYATGLCLLTATSSAEALILELLNLHWTHETAESVVEEVTTSAAGNLIKYGQLQWAKGPRGIAIGKGLIYLVDPPAGVAYTGEVDIRFDPTLLSPKYTGWVGPFGLDPSLPASPASPGGFLPDGGPFYLQPPNAALQTTVTVNKSAGLIVATFNAGPSGLPLDTSDDMNFFGVIFDINAEAFDPDQVYLLENVAQGQGDLGQVAGAGGFVCSVAGDIRKEMCGRRDPPDDIKFTAAPEPSTLSLSLIAVSLVMIWMVRRHKLGRLPPSSGLGRM